VAGRKRLGAEQRREQLLDVAVDLAAGGDLSAVSVQDIAARAGVSEGLLYHYFPTKDALLLAAVQRAADAMAAALSVAAVGQPLDALTAGLAAYLDHVQSDSTGWRALLQARTGALADVAQAVEQQSQRLTLELLGVQDPSPVLLTALEGWAALERQVCLGWLSAPAIPRVAVEELLLSSFLSVLTAAAQHDQQARDVMARLGVAPGAVGSATSGPAAPSRPTV
jgi:AcrR family transcriptional regulator